MGLFIINGAPNVGDDLTSVSADIATLEGKVDTVDTVVDAVKAKTDNLPVSPAATADIANALVVPTKNTADNDNVMDVVGNKTDDESGNSIYAKAYIADKHKHSPQKVYPTLASGVTLTGGAGAWELGSKIEVVPANTITNPFDIHWINCGAFSATDTYEIVFYKGAALSEVEIGRCRISRATAQSGTAPTPIQTEIIPANTRISAAIASSSGGGDTGVISLFYHEY